MSINKKSQLVDGYWVVGTNKWDTDIYTQEQAEKYAGTLFNCSNCINCSYCRNCHDCYYCHSCNYCNYCHSCHDCYSCLDCSDFKTNPERITSPKIGSRHNHTTYYWTKEHEQIVCGCFIGTLLEFESKVKETHGDNQHAKDYFNWIEKVKLYIKGDKKS